jgi:hypothetical protein
MRRRRFQRGSITPRKRNGKRYWYVQWRVSSCDVEFVVFCADGDADADGHADDGFFLQLRLLCIQRGCFRNDPLEQRC